MNEILAIERPRREWVYISSPNELCYGPCVRCGGTNFSWSNIQGCVWCWDCFDDVHCEHYGVVDGPIIVECCKLLGMNFDALDLLTRTVVPFESPIWPNNHLKNPTQI
jgi:hypothetical protein